MISSKKKAQSFLPIEKEENLEISIVWFCMLQITVSLTWRAECT